MDYVIVFVVGFVVGALLQVLLGAKIHAEVVVEVAKVVDAYHKELAAAKAEIATLKKLV